MKKFIFRLQCVVALGIVTILFGMLSARAADQQEPKQSAQASVVQALAFLSTQEGLDKPLFVTAQESEGGFVVGVYKLTDAEFGSASFNTNDERRVALIQVRGEKISVLAMTATHVAPKNLVAHNAVVAALALLEKSGSLLGSFQMKAESTGAGQATVDLRSYPLVTGGHTFISVKPSGMEVMHGA